MSEAFNTLVPTQIVVNGVSHTLTLDPRSTLLDVLREHLDLIRR
jgi:aerobic-type carbon monoxide dehydrogenase small subunit (CoxS/CutS family)